MASKAPKAPPPPSSQPPPPPPRHPHFLETQIRKCIPKELIPETWKFYRFGVDQPGFGFTHNMESLFSHAQPQLGMFDSAKDLADNVAQYMDFPKDDEHFKLNRTTRVDGFPDIPKSVSGKWCMYINDLYKIFDYHKLTALKSEPFSLAEQVFEDTWEELRVKKNYQMIVCPHEPVPPSFEKAQEGVTLSELVAQKCTVPVNGKIDWYKMEQAARDSMTEAILIKMSNYHEYGSYSFVDNREAQKVASWVGFIMGEAVTFIQKIEGIYLWPATPFAEPVEKLTPVIRLFSTDNKSFVMAHDLVEYLFEYDGLSLQYMQTIQKIKKMPNLATLSYEDTMEIVKETGNPALEKLEYAKMKNDLLMFNQTPIPHYLQGYCILAADALYELLMDMIVAKKVFHTFQKKDWEEIQNFFESIKSHFDLTKDIYFMDLEEVGNIKKEWEACYDEHLKRESKPIQLKKDKFDVNGLIRTLKSQKLDKCFEDIVEYAHPIFSEMENLKLNGKMWTSPNYLYVAIAQCQMNCLARKVPWILEFIEKQNSCNRMNIMNITTGDGGYDVDRVAAELEQMGTSDKKQGAKRNVATKKSKNNKRK